MPSHSKTAIQMFRAILWCQMLQMEQVLRQQYWRLNLYNLLVANTIELLLKDHRNTKDTKTRLVGSICVLSSQVLRRLLLLAKEEKMSHRFDVTLVPSVLLAITRVVPWREF